MARPTRKSCHRRRASHTKKAPSKPPNKSSQKLLSLFLVLLRVFLWTLVLVMSNLFPGAEGLAKSLCSLIQLLLADLDDD